MKKLVAVFALGVLTCAAPKESPRSEATTGESRPPRPTIKRELTALRAHSPAPVRVGGDVVAPVVIHRVDPDLSKLPRHFRYSGVVLVEAVNGERGVPRDIRVLKGQPELAETTVAALRRWRFRPGTLHGKPVPVIFNMTSNPHFL